MEGAGRPRRPCLRIVRQLFAALADLAWVIAHRPGALERVALLLQDWNHAHRRLADTEQRMMGVLDELGLTEARGRSSWTTYPTGSPALPQPS